MPLTHLSWGERPKVKKQNTYPHMCRDGHQQIGHSDSEHEQCPLCRALDAAKALRHTIDNMLIYGDDREGYERVLKSTAWIKEFREV